MFQSLYLCAGHERTPGTGVGTKGLKLKRPGCQPLCLLELERMVGWKVTAPSIKCPPSLCVACERGLERALYRVQGTAGSSHDLAGAFEGAASLLRGEFCRRNPGRLSVLQPH